MKHLKKLIAILCIVMLALTSLVACGGDNGGDGDNETEEINTKQTQLYVANFNGGFGQAWIDAFKKSFEQKYADVSFEEGKTGVQIMISNSKTNGQTWLTEVDSSMNEVFFTEWFYLGDYISQNKLLDITDVVTDPLDASTVINGITGKTEKVGATGEGSIADKLNEQQKSYYSRNGVYYALPHYQAYTSIVYDIDLFEDNKLYFAFEKDNGNDGFIRKSTDKRSAGPDGALGTKDDGLPATFEEFYALCAYMKELGITPIAWTGGNQVYISEFNRLLMTNLCGEEETILNYDMQGTSTTLLEDDGKTLMPATDITLENAYLLARQKGKLQAFEFIEGIIRGEYYDVTHSFAGISHLQMQSDFLWSRFDSTKDIAMIVEGNWWENEAEATFDEMKNTPGAKKSERRFGTLPLPWATQDQVGSEYTYLDSNYSGCFIKASIAPEKIPLAKLFLQYCCTNEQLATYTTITGQPQSFNYTLTDEQYNGLTYYEKECWDTHCNATFVYPYSASKIYNFAPTAFSTSHFNNSTYKGVAQQMSHVSFRNNPSITALLYWKGTVELSSKSAWESNYSSLFNK